MLDMCHKSTKKLPGPYSLLEEILCETKHASYISILFNSLVPKHRIHNQATFVFQPDTGFGKSNRKQGLILC